LRVIRIRHRLAAPSAHRRIETAIEQVAVGEAVKEIADGGIDTGDTLVHQNVACGVEPVFARDLHVSDGRIAGRVFPVRDGWRVSVQRRPLSFDPAPGIVALPGTVPFTVLSHPGARRDAGTKRRCPPKGTAPDLFD